MRRAEWREIQSPSFAVSNSDPETFHVAYRLCYDDLTTGADEGIVAFVDGWMVVEGRSTGFALRPCDVSVGWDYALTLVGGGWIQFGASDRPVEFEETLAQWCRSTSPEGEPVFPPARIHRTSVRRAALPGFAAVPLGVAAWFLVGESWVSNLAAAGCAIIAAYAVAGSWIVVSQLRQRDRFFPRT